MSTDTYLAVFLGSKTSPKMAAWNALSEAERKAKEVLGGYWMIEVASRAEAIAWARRCPAAPNEIIEIRQVQEMADLPPDVQAAAAGFDGLKN